jgi:NAD(P)-dependent dehydrogenase (short-subunit alcohol dehydrogenase family)
MAFANKHVLITGGSEGLGLALAKQLASQHARVSLIARTLSKLEAAEQAVLASYPQQQQRHQQQQAQQQQHSNNEQQEQLVYYHSADVTKYRQVSMSSAKLDISSHSSCMPTSCVSPSRARNGLT